MQTRPATHAEAVYLARALNLNRSRPHRTPNLNGQHKDTSPGNRNRRCATTCICLPSDRPPTYPPEPC